MAKSPPTKWALSPDVIYIIAQCFNPDETVYSTISRREYAEMKETLRNLSVTCKAIWHCLEPVRHHLVVIRNCVDIVKHFVQLAKNPQTRQYVRHIYCKLSRANFDRGREVWVRSCGLATRPRKLLEDNGYKLSPSSREIEKPTPIRRTRRTLADVDRKFMRTPETYDFMLGSILMMITHAESVTYLGHNCHMNPFGGIIDEAQHGGIDFLSHVRTITLGHAKFAPRALMRFSELLWEPSLWHSLRRLVFKNMDFDVDFGILIRGKFFAPDMDIQELVFRVDDGMEDRGRREMPMRDFAATVRRLITQDREQHLFQAFRNLRILEVDFPYASDFEGEVRSSPVLYALINEVGAPETLHLKGHPFPHEALGWSVHNKLKVLSVKKRGRLDLIVLDNCGVYSQCASCIYFSEFSKLPVLETLGIDDSIYYLDSERRISLRRNVWVEQDSGSRETVDLTGSD